MVDVDNDDEIMRIKFFQLMFDKPFDDMFKDHPVFKKDDSDKDCHENLLRHRIRLRVEVKETK